MAAFSALLAFSARLINLGTFFVRCRRRRSSRDLSLPLIVITCLQKWLDCVAAESMGPEAVSRIVAYQPENESKVLLPQKTVNCQLRFSRPGNYARSLAIYRQRQRATEVEQTFDCRNYQYRMTDD